MEGQGLGDDDKKETNEPFCLFGRLFFLVTRAVTGLFFQCPGDGIDRAIGGDDDGKGAFASEPRLRFSVWGRRAADGLHRTG